MRKTPLAGTLAALTVACACFGRDPDARMSKDAEQTAKSIEKSLITEIHSLPDHPWAGDYYAGDGLGVGKHLRLAPQSGFLFEWHGCLGVYDRNYGIVTTTNGVVHLSFTFENVQAGFRGLEPAFIVLKWGDRHYLIPTNQVVDFCNSVNSGLEPRDQIHGTQLLRKGDEKKPVTGPPGVPPGYERFLLAKPIHANIISVKPYSTRPSAVEWKFKDTPVVLDAGSAEGLLPGMKLFTEQAGFVSAVITSVEEHRSCGMITQMGEERPGPEVGWKFSTCAFTR